MSDSVAVSLMSPTFQLWLKKKSNKPSSKESPNNFVFKSKKLSGVVHLNVALQHNLRESAMKNGSYNGIDLSRTSTNVTLRTFGSAEDTMLHTYRTVQAAGYRPEKERKDMVWGIEIVFVCLPPPGTSVEEFYGECTRWAETYLGIPVLSSVVHMDQGSPHCHVILLPLKNNHMDGGRIYGNGKVMSARMKNFFYVFGDRLGIKYPTKPKKGSAELTKLTKNRLYEFLAEKSELMEDQIHILIKELKDPASALAKLGLRIRTADKATGFTRIMTAQGCGA